MVDLETYTWLVKFRFILNQDNDCHEDKWAMCSRDYFKNFQGYHHPQMHGATNCPSLKDVSEGEGYITCVLPYRGIFFDQFHTRFKYFTLLSYSANLHQKCLLIFVRNSV